MLSSAFIWRVGSELSCKQNIQEALTQVDELWRP